MDWSAYAKGILDTVIYCLVGILMMGIGIFLVCLVAPFSVKKEIEDDQNVSLGLVMGAIIIGIAIIVAGVLSSPGGDYLTKKVQGSTGSVTELKKE
jgi:uncharacterized membrane protein YjfL (UPF0719 family)